MTSIRCVAEAGAELGEGPLWDAGRSCLWWLDIKGRRLLRFDPATQTSGEATLPVRLTALAPAGEGQLLACGDEGFGFLDPERVCFTPWRTPDGEVAGNRFNDGKTDAQGRFWAGTMDDAEEMASGALHRLDPDGKVSRIAEGFHVPNGPAFDSKGRMYLADSARRLVYRFTAGAAIDRDHAVFATFTEEQGYPDGMTCDAADHLWIAFWDGWCVRRLSPDGAIVAEIRLPVQRPTSCAFGGAGYGTLYVTSAATGIDGAARARQPLAGGLFAMDLETPGLAPVPFGYITSETPIP